MIILLGGTGYIGQAFARSLSERGRPFASLSRTQVDYSRFEILLDYLRQTKPDFLINAAGYTGKPNVDACELARADTLAGNILLPQTIAHACLATGTPWGHVSSGCIFSGAKILEGGQTRVEKDLTRPELQALLERNPGAIHGYTETDEPNFTFRRPPCSFYSGSKALAEELLARGGPCYLWRLRIPFDALDHPRNYLSKVQQYEKVYDNVNSITHRQDFARACLDLWERRAPFGTYNMTNPGCVTTRQVVSMIQEILRPNREFRFWANDAEFYQKAAQALRSNCVLDTAKLVATGVKMRPVEEALADSLRHWQPSERSQRNGA